jgi:hypothetical protein
MVTMVTVVCVFNSSHQNAKERKKNYTGSKNHVYIH